MTLLRPFESSPQDQAVLGFRNRINQDAGVKVLRGSFFLVRGGVHHHVHIYLFQRTDSEEYCKVSS